VAVACEEHDGRRRHGARPARVVIDALHDSRHEGFGGGARAAQFKWAGAEVHNLGREAQQAPVARRDLDAHLAQRGHGKIRQAIRRGRGGGRRG
jgi:hypothetical protein